MKLLSKNAGRMRSATKISVLAGLAVVGGFGPYTKDGQKIGSALTKGAQPHMVVATVDITAGVGILPLNSSFDGIRYRTAPTNDTALFVAITKMAEDTTETAYAYEWVMSGDSIIIKSSGDDADTGKVSVMAITR